MTKLNYIEYSSLYVDTIVVGQHIDYSSNAVKISESRNKIALYSSIYRNPSVFATYDTGCAYTVSEGDTIFVTPDCKTPRDLFRNSGYKLTRDPEKAKSIVFPKIFPNKIVAFRYNILCKDKNDDRLHICTVRTSANSNSYWPYGNNDYDRIKAYFAATGFDMEYYTPVIDEYEQNYVELIPDYPVFKEMIDAGTNNLRKYICEDVIRITPSTNISVETLMLWKNMGDGIFQKALQTSDWREYPLTVLAFLYGEDKYSSCYSDRGYQLICNQVGLEISRSSGKLMQTFSVVTPKDWNMLQDWILFRFGLSEKGGFVNPKFDNGAFKRYKPFIRSAFCVSPLRVTANVDARNLVSLN